MDSVTNTCGSYFKVVAKPTSTPKPVSLKRKHPDDQPRHTASAASACQQPITSRDISHAPQPPGSSSDKQNAIQSYASGYGSAQPHETREKQQVQSTCIRRGIFSFYIREEPEMLLPVSDRYLLIEKKLCESLLPIDLPPTVAGVYNSLEYAFETHYDFVKKYCNREKKVLFLGMNPGPYGMSQNGVPFGEVKMVRDWLRISGQVQRPTMEHPKRPVLGLDCRRSEVSGARFWGFFQKLCGQPEVFFYNCFIYNVCPLGFVAETGKNITPPELPAVVQREMNQACERALLEVMSLLKIRIVVGVGKFAYECAQKVLRMSGLTGIKVEYLMHPSPGNPAANRGWDGIAFDQLQKMGILPLITATDLPHSNQHL